MFIKPKAFTGPPGSTVTFEVRSRKGAKPFPTRIAADSYAKEQRSEEGGWAEVTQVIRIVVEKRS